MEKGRGICTACGLVNEFNHNCSGDIQRLREIDEEAGPRAVREFMLAQGHKGFNNKIETLEAEAAAIRSKQ